MQTFLEKTAGYICQKYGDDISNLCFVLPTHRARLYLKKNIAQQYNKTIWSPEIFSIEDFVTQLSGLQIIENTILIFELYNTHKTVEGKDAETFDEFINWGQTLLHDFNDIDLYLADAKNLFTNLTESKALAVWNLDTPPLTDYQRKYLKFYNSLYAYYKEFTEQLISKKQAYQGLAYKHLADNIEEKAKQVKWSKIIFVGFNALTAAEEKTIQTLSKLNKAEILWDADKYYIDDTKQEAGKFIRDYIKKRNLKDFKWMEDNFADTKKNITITGIPLHIGQAKFAGQLIQAIDKEALQKTAIVLPDENLLIPVLNSIPKTVSEFNVTMGLYLKYTPLFQLFNSLFALHENANKFGRMQSDNYTLYYKDILKILNHPYIIKLSNSTSVKDLPTEVIQSTNKIFYTMDELEAVFADNSNEYFLLIKPLFEDWHEQTNKALDSFTYLIKLLLESFTSAAYSQSQKNIETEYLYNFAKIVKQTRYLTDNYGITGKIKTLRTLFTKIIQTFALPFFGEPLKGLQIMGMLETRTLDFENIIVLSVNENIIPSAKTTNSFIPLDIRYEFHLPTYKDKEAIFAYHFYRLLQRAENIHLLYNTENDDFGSGEKSRFITQLIHELPKYNSEITIKHNIISIPTAKDNISSEIIIPKTHDIIEKLKHKAEQGFSPTVFNTYVNCTLQFYFQEVAKLKEIEETEETIEASTLGTIIHEVLNNLYTPHINTQINADTIKQMIPRVETLIKQTLKKHFTDDYTKYGKNLLTVNVAHKLIVNFLKEEIKSAKGNRCVTIKHLEKDINTKLYVSSAGNLVVKIKGKIDRIDTSDNTLRIIDYKTGRIDAKESKTDEWEALITDTDKAKSLQLLMYAYLFNKNNNENKHNIETGIISFREPSKGFMKISLPEANTLNETTFQQIEELIKELIADIFNPDTPFTQIKETAHCEYCQFKNICNR